MSLTLSVGTMLGAVVLLCAFLQISQLRFVSMLRLSQIEAWALGAAAFWQGFVQHAWSLYGVGVLVLAVQIVVLPRLFRRGMVFFNTRMEVQNSLPTIWPMLGGLLPVLLAVLAVAPSPKTVLSPMSEGVSMALSIMLLGLWAMVVHRQPLAQIIGFITLENGLILGLINAPKLGWAMDVAVLALLGMLACLICVSYWRYGAPRETKADRLE